MKRTKKEILSDVKKEVKTSKFIDNNTVKIEYTDGTSAIRLHNTDVITFNKDKIILNSGGWRTKTTKERINQYNGIGLNIWQSKGIWTISGFDFYDGITFNKEGKLIGKNKTVNIEKIDKLKKKISKFVNLITKDNLPLPNSGDCWLCALVDEDNKPMGNDNNDHLMQHIKENYMHGSLIVNAMRDAGYSDTQIGFHYQAKITDSIKRAVRKYLQKRLILNIAIK